MTAREQAYPKPGFRIRVPAELWQRTLEVMRRYSKLRGHSSKRGSEAIVYWAGVVTADEMVITALYELNHEPQGDRVQVTPDEARWLVRTLASRDEKLVAQVHSHRGGAGHSHGDDLWATSFHEGFVSIVIPGFGSDVTNPVRCAALDYREGHFRPMTPEEVERRIRVAPARVVKPQAWLRKDSIWERFVQKLKSIEPSRR
jgi:hypothetical protein